MKTEKLSDTITIINADCHEWSGVADAVISDPPYGMDWIFTGQGSGTNAQGGKNSVTKGQRIEGDAEDFDPAPWLLFPRVVLWGFHHYPQHLERGTVLVWVKKYFDAWDTFLSDADLAWMKGGCGVYLSATINPAKFQAEKVHPTQKPVELMSWCMDKAKVDTGATVLDPYMGSGTTGIACIRTGRRFIGIEIDEQHYQTARKRLMAELAQTNLFRQDEDARAGQGECPGTACNSASPKAAQESLELGL